MRIGIDYTAALHQKAGIGRYTRSLVRALASLDQENNYLLLVSGRTSPTDSVSQLPETFQFRYLPLSQRWTTAIWHRLRLPIPADLFTGKVDLFHSPDFVLPPLLRGQKILTIHDLSFYRYPDGAEPSLLWYLRGAVPRSVSRADFLFADSENTKQDLIEILGVEEDKIAVIYPGCDDHFQPDPMPEDERVRREYRLEDSFILSVGTIEPRKNFGGLMRAYRLLRDEHKIPQRLVIAGGKGWLYQGIFQEMEDLGITPEVRFLGYVPEHHLPSLYRLATAFAFPSHYEGFGLPPLEAMACGTPVVVSNTSSLPEVVGDAGLLVDPRDIPGLAQAIYRLLSDSALRQELRRIGLEQAGKFSWEKSARQVLGHYYQIIGD